MAIGVRSDRIAAYIGTASVITYAVTVPAGQLWLVKDICIQSGYSGSETLDIYVHVAATNQDFIVKEWPGVTLGQTMEWQGFIALEAGDKLGLKTDHTGNHSFIAFGAKLIL